MVGLKIRRKPVAPPPFNSGAIVRIRENIGALQRNTVCRVIRCSSFEASVKPLVGSFAGEQIDVSLENLKQE